MGTTTLRARRWARAAAASAVAAAVVASGSGSTSSAAPEAPARPSATTTLSPTVRVPIAIVRPSGIAPAPDGSLYVSEEATASVYRIAPDGTRVELPLDLVAPKGLHLADDGTLSIADGPRITTVAPDGTQGEIPVAGATLLGWVDVDAAGARYALDVDASRLVKISPDGTQETLPVAGDPALSGLAVADDGTVTVLDIEAGEVVRRAPDGTETRIAVPGAEGGQSVDDDGERIAIGASGDVLLREADGTVSEVIAQGLAVQVELADDGTVWSVATGITGCRCPEGPGAVHRRPAGGPDEIVPLGDIATLGTVAANADRSVLFTSFDGPRGYSSANPLRASVAVDAFEDLPVDDASEVDADAQGTQVLRLERFGPASLARRSPDGTITEIALPTEPGIDVIAGYAVDQDGTIAAVLGSGYGTGPFTVFSIAPDGAVEERYRSDSSTGFLAVGAGAGRIVVAEVEGSQGRLVDVGDGPPTPIADVPPFLTALEVDAAGSIWSIRYPTSGPQLDVLRADGSTDAYRYEGIANPTSLSTWTDGTLYVADGSVGVLSLGQIAGIAVPSGPPPAVPVPGTATFTG